MDTRDLKSLYEDSVAEGERYTTLPAIDLSGQTIQGQCLSCVDFGRSNLSNTIWVECDLRGSTFQDAQMDNATMARCMTYGCVFPPNSKIEFKGCTNTVVKKANHKATLEDDKYMQVFNAAFSKITNTPNEKLLLFTIVISVVTTLIAIIRLT